MQDLPKKPKDKEEGRERKGGTSDGKDASVGEKDGNQPRSYYYDDAYGYEDYDPEEDPESDGPD